MEILSISKSIKIIGVSGDERHSKIKSIYVLNCDIIKISHNQLMTDIKS